MYISGNVVYCNLGTMTMSNSGNYICVSPKVIERADKFALSLVEFNKVPLMNICFKAKVISTAGVNLTSVMVGLDFKTNYTMRYGFMVVVIGYQPENTWIDVYNFELPESYNLSIPQTTSKWHWFTYQNSDLSQRLQSFTQLVEFTSSFGGEVISPGTYVYFYLWASAYSWIGQVDLYLRVEKYVGLQSFNGGVILIDSSKLNASVDFYSNQAITFTSSNNIINITTAAKNFGPSFNTKCLLAFPNIAYSSRFTIELKNSTFNNYNTVNISLLPPQILYESFAMMCVGNKMTSQCEQSQYEDHLTNACYLFGSDCPVPTYSFFNTKNWCLKCSQTQCVSCNESNRLQCFECNSALFMQALSGQCKCISGYGRNTFGQCVVCEYFYPKCAECDNQTSGCSKCMAEFGIGTSGRCVGCMSLYPNCKLCSSYLSGCSQCSLGYGINSSGKCYACSSLDSNCLLCSSNGNCTQCVAGFGLNAFGNCTSCSSLYSNCLTCRFYNDGCSQCEAGFGVNPQKQCSAFLSIDVSLEPSSSESTLNIVLSVLGFVIFVIIIVCICVKCYCPNRDFQPSTQPQLAPPQINPQLSNVAQITFSQPYFRPLNNFGLQCNRISNEYKSEKDEVCSICLDNQMNCRTSCRHNFHLQCFSAWIKRSANCPVCKRENFNDIVIFCAACYKHINKIKIEPNKMIEDNDTKCNDCLNHPGLNHSEITLCFNE